MMEIELKIDGRYIDTTSVCFALGAGMRLVISMSPTVSAQEVTSKSGSDL